MDKKTGKSASCVCGICDKNFFNLYNLRRHIKQFHPSQTQLLPTLQSKNKDNYKYSCDECKKYFNNVYKFNFHNKKEHGLRQVSLSAKKKCGLCEYSTFTKVDIINHFEIGHNIKIEVKKMEFSSIEKFKEWKSGFEGETVAKFELEKTEKSKHFQVAKYMCHRSGFYKTRGKGKRHLKTQGSQKINAFCPAGIKNVIDTKGKCQTHIVIIHVGHQNEIQHIQLTRQERRNLAMKSTAKMPFDKIRNTELSRNNTSQRKTFEENKQKIFNLLNKLIKRVHNTSSPSKLKAIEKVLTTISPTINAMENDRNSLKSSIAEAHNKKINVQKRLFSTHKRRNNINKDIRKLSSETQVLAASLLPQEDDPFNDPN